MRKITEEFHELCVAVDNVHYHLWYTGYDGERGKEETLYISDQEFLNLLTSLKNSIENVEELIYRTSKEE